jgi:hypothetical protein
MYGQAGTAGEAAQNFGGSGGINGNGGSPGSSGGGGGGGFFTNGNSGSSLAPPGFAYLNGGFGAESTSNSVEDGGFGGGCNGGCEGEAVIRNEACMLPGCYEEAHGTSFVTTYAPISLILKTREPLRF